MLSRKLAPELMMSQTNLAGLVRESDSSEEKTPWVMEMNAKLVGIFAEHAGRAMTGEDIQWQTVRYLTRKVEKESGCGEWRDERLEQRGFEGWRAMIVKIHQVLACVLQKKIVSDTISNEWDCTAVTARIHDMHANHKLVENFIDKIKTQIPHKILVRFSHDVEDVNAECGMLVISAEMLWYAVQAGGRFDEALEEFVEAQMAGKDVRASRAMTFFRQAQYSERVFGEKFGWYCLVLSQQGQDFRSLMAEIRSSVKVSSINPCDKTAHRRLETLLVLMRGHESEEVRMEAEIMLHMLQDGHDWQEHSALAVSYAFVDERVDIRIPEHSEGELLVLELCAPLLGPEVRPVASEVMTRYSTKQGANVSLFPTRCGFYDYRVRSSRGDTLKSGRIIVHPADLRNLQLKELSAAASVDFRGALDEAVESGYSGFLVSDLTSEGNRSHTNPDTKWLLKQSNQSALYVSMSLHVSALRSHRKYRDLFVQRMTRSGLSVTQSLLNYRLLDTWDLLVDEMAVWARECGAKGVRLSEGYYEAPLYAKDLEELLRKDEDDGRLHYEVMDALGGLLVKSDSLSLRNDGAYGSAFYSRTLRSLWRRFPHFTLFVDVGANDGDLLARSGAVPIVHGSVHQPRITLRGPSCIRIPNDELRNPAGELWALTGPEIPVFGNVESSATRALQRLRRSFISGDFIAISNHAWAWRAKPGAKHVAALTIVVVNHEGGGAITKTFPLKALLAGSTYPYYIESGLEADGVALWAGEELEETEFELTVKPAEFVVRIFRGAEHLSPRREKALLRESMLRCGSFFQRQLAEALKSDSDGAFRKLFNSARGVGDLGLWRRNVLGVYSGASESEGWSRCVAMMKSIGEMGILEENQLGSVAFVTPELGKWSTAGGLGVMVDELSTGLGGRFMEDVMVISPYYDRNNQGEFGYLEKDGIRWILNVEVYVGDKLVTLGVHEGRVNNVRVVFLHNAKYFPVLYPAMTPSVTMSFLVLLARGALEVCRRLGVCPGTIVTNDWATGLVAAYGKRDGFFAASRFLHIVHNLDPSYEGRVFPSRFEDLGRIHRLPMDLLVDPHWSNYCMNPSRCALLSSDLWGTVSRSYRDELLAGSALNALLRLHPRPFAHPNGIPLESRLERLKATGVTSHAEAKALIQKRYFGMQKEDPEMALLGFVGRITQQKGVHMIVDIAEQIIRRFNFKIQIFVAGKGSVGDPYSDHCVHRLWDLRRRFPKNFWADPNLFFRDGPLLNMASDFGLMPSMFEPGGIVQQEFFIAGTPVIAFKTGGLKDTVKEFYDMNDGNGFTFESYSSGDFAFAIDRALKIRNDEVSFLKLRENARSSVVTCEMVGRAWLAAMYEMHGKFFVDKMEVEKNLAGILKGEVDVADDAEEEESRKSDSCDSQLEPSTPKSTAMMLRVFSTSSVSSVLVTKKQVRVLYRLPFGLSKPHNVALCGSFDNWGARYPMQWDARVSAFAVELRLSVGTHAVKVVSDGVWRTMPDYPVVRDDSGNENNLLSVN